MASTSQDSEIELNCSLAAGPHQPILNFPKQTFGKQQRSSWYSRYPWIHYVQEKDAVVCSDCTIAIQRKMPISGYVDKVFTETGFNNWQKALQKCDKHQQSQSHKFAVNMVMRERRKARGVNEILSSAHAQEMEHNRNNFLVILSSIRFLARQGLPIRGHYINDAIHGSGELNGNLMQLLHLRTEDIPELVAWLKRAQDRFTSPTIQNEVLEIMALAVLRKLTGRISGRQYASLVDETPDISNIEQLVFCLRYVDDQLDSHENFIGLHSLESTRAS